MIQVFYPDPDSGSGFRIRIPDPDSGSGFFTHPGSRGQKAPEPGSGFVTPDLTPYLAYGTYPALRCPRPWRSLSSGAPDRAPQQAGPAFLAHQCLADIIMKFVTM
jgi:hypothetical protein